MRKGTHVAFHSYIKDEETMKFKEAKYRGEKLGGPAELLSRAVGQRLVTRNAYIKTAEGQNAAVFCPPAYVLIAADLLEDLFTLLYTTH
ncbi:predicted protein [Verticillium alfalfae VaMs.102]|uniref:Predicted protein n=1 Tax=Verticillium alfalfae (strain VaMs.102 / ATCC MYA-4576 / FGSC 10136) TaxID=526221 RepID=C9SER0_VERA1|nr:predicted protein [Verticillium alfalfae VaMs.102]EEY16653.1 predicted protein [Verticillium alfalfae VaMs.102]